MHSCLQEFHIVLACNSGVFQFFFVLFCFVLFCALACNSGICNDFVVCCRSSLLSVA